MIISEHIFYILTQKGMTQKQFSERTGISQSTISDWKTKKTNPAADKIMVICDVLEITPYELLLSTENRGSKQTDYVILDKKSEDYLFLEAVKKMGESDRRHLLEYIQKLITK